MKTERFEYLDSMRGIACLMVIFCHYVYSICAANDIQNFFKKSYTNIFIAGGLAVCIFFILSGFVLSYNIIGEKNIKTKILQAIIKRPIRLAGVVYFTSIPVLFFLFDKNFWEYRMLADYDIYLDIIYRYIFDVFRFGATINSPLWTISVELWGSFLTFGFVLIAGSWNKKYRISLLIILFIYFIDSYYCAFIFGIMIADIRKNFDIKNIIFKSIKNTILILSLLLCFVVFIYCEISNIKYGIEMVYAMVIFISVLYCEKIHKILKYESLLFIGKISYSLYAVHFLIMLYICRPLYSILLASFSETEAFLAMFIVTFPLILLSAYIIDKYIDKPCINFSGWFTKKLVGEVQEKIKKCF